MGLPDELVDDVEVIDVVLEPVRKKPVDMTDPDWLAKLQAGPRPLDEADVREEAETALRELLALYETDEQTRIEVRALLNRCQSFS
jgi:hypothetical protein